MTKFLSALFVSASLLSATACQKPTDTGRVQEEALAVVKVHAATIEQLQRRADAALTRGRTLGNGAPGIADAGRRLTEARAQLDQLKGLTSSAPTVIAAAAKTGDIEEMDKVIDGLTEKLEDGSAAARADITAVESWLAASEGVRPPAPGSAPVTEPPHTGTPQGGAGSGAGVQAPADGTVPPGASKPTSPGAPTGTPTPTKPAPTGTAPAKPATGGSVPTKPAPTPAPSTTPNAGGSPTGGANPTPK